MKKHLLLIPLLASILGNNVQAQTVSEADAYAKAEAFLDGGAHHAPGASSIQIAYKAAKGNETYFYVFNRGVNEGYVIIGGDEAAREVLAYGEIGHFVYEQLPPQMQWWLGEYEVLIREAISKVKSGDALLCEEGGAKHAPKMAGTRTNIPYLLTTEWDQVAPYNSQIPLYAEGFTGLNALATGCVATAGAQVMKYYNWPEHGVGSHTLTKKYNNLTFSADFENTTYQWDQMKESYDYDTYSGSSSEKAVGTLMYHVGVAVDMEYGQLSNGGSSSSTRNMACRLVDTFKYSKSISYENRSYYSNDEWEELIYSELLANRPVLYRGASEEGGHAFVCDGYKDGHFHINWGWSGQHNNYFLLTPTAIEPALTPDGTGSGGSAAGSSYTIDQGAVIGIVPDYDGTSQVHKAMSVDSYTLTKSEAAFGELLTINGLIYNDALMTTDYSYGLRFVNIEDPEVIIEVSLNRTETLEPSTGYQSMSFTLPALLTIGETYYVYPLFIGDNGEWQKVNIPLNATIPSVKVIAPTGLALTHSLRVSNNGYVSASYGTVSYAVTNFASSAYSTQLVAFIFPAFGGSSLGYMYVSDTFVPNEEQAYSATYSELNGKENLSVGSSYFFKLMDYGTREYLSGVVPFTVVDDLSITFSITDAGWATLCLPFETEVPVGMTAYTVTGTEDNRLVLVEAESIEMNKPYLVTGTPNSYQFGGPATPTGSAYKNGLMVGNTSPVATAPAYAPAGSYVLQKNNGVLGFYKVRESGKQKVRQYSAYLQVPASSSCYDGFVIGDESEGIQQIVSMEQLGNATFNITGVCVDDQQKGLIIKNGKISFLK